MIEDKEIHEILQTRGKHLYRREGQSLEFKEQFNLAGLAEYLRDFAAFANNKGGLLVFGVTDAPRTAAGLSEKALNSFNKLDPERLTGFILQIFSSDIQWDATVIEYEGKHFAAFKVYEAAFKPIVTRKDEGKDQTLRNGDIYYRYGGRTQRIQSAELEAIIAKRIEGVSRDWIQLVKEIGPAGPRGAFVLNTSEQVADDGHFVVDKSLAQKLKFVKEGHFRENDGAAALKLVGDVVPVDTIEIEKVVKENLFEEYPYSAIELASAVKKTHPNIGQNAIWKSIEENDLKGNPDYASYNFRNMRQQKEYETTGRLPSSTPVIYSKAALAFLVKLFEVEATQ